MHVVVVVGKDRYGRWAGFADALQAAGHRVEFMRLEASFENGQFLTPEEVFARRCDVLFCVSEVAARTTPSATNALTVFWVERSGGFGSVPLGDIVVVSPFWDVVDAAGGARRAFLWLTPPCRGIAPPSQAGGGVVVVGVWHPVREQVVRALAEKGIGVRGVGAGWSRARLKRSLYRATRRYEDMLAEIAKADVVVYLLCRGLNGLLSDCLHMGKCVVVEPFEGVDLLGEGVCVAGDVVTEAGRLAVFDLGRRRYESAAGEVVGRFAPQRLIQALLDA
ncbi:MAG: hypothetical protein DRP63_06880 [Planctomycetota bacterium]|nr:MAG: hypothetical protein DRP63_06880 [Planctomycetota bacterium]